MALHEDAGWHTGEDKMHELLRVPDRDNPTSLYLTPFAASLLQRSPLLAVGTLDSSGRPWTSLWGGEPGFSRPVAQSVLGVKTIVDREYDPVIETLLGKKANGEIIKEEGLGRMVSGLAIDLESRMRVKLYGRMIAGALSATTEGIAEVQLVVNILQSLGNCPKYLNKKKIIPSLPMPNLVSDSLPLIQPALDTIAKADLFFISSSNHELDMDTNHRGGPPGFVRVLSNDENGCVLIYPEYSGNRLYQTLGNLTTTPKAGLVFPDFDTGNVLYVTGTTEVLVAEAASRLLPRTNLAVKITVQAARYVERGLPFRGEPGELSPYNPPVKLLMKEQKHILPSDKKQIYAKLVEKTLLAPTIARFRFHIIDPQGASRWKPGQYVAFDFSDELDIGYSHMRDDDPRSLNDDFLRTFTVSSPPGDLSGYDQFEITIRKVGVATRHLFRHNPRTNLEIPLKGFGGEFIFQQDEGERVNFIAGGVGITPVLAQAPVMDLDNLRLFWTVRAADLGLVSDSFEQIPGLIKATRLFVTGAEDDKAAKILSDLKTLNVKITKRRLAAEDLGTLTADNPEKWYICTGTTLRTALLQWLQGQNVFYEDFDY